MTITIYGLVGYANKLQMPLENLEMEELAIGEEFMFKGKVYEIRSVAEDRDGYLINVSLTMNEAWN